MDGDALLGSPQPRPPLEEDDELLDEIPTLTDLLKEQARLRRAIDPEELFTSVRCSSATPRQRWHPNVPFLMS
jgi:hypothetical protein